MSRWVRICRRSSSGRDERVRPLLVDILVVVLVCWLWLLCKDYVFMILV